jgi:hypothetical protein
MGGKEGNWREEMGNKKYKKEEKGGERKWEREETRMEKIGRDRMGKSEKGEIRGRKWE